MSDSSKLRKLFISHSHKDEPLAAAFREALTNIFGKIQVAFSSDKKAGGGPQPGANWLEWIHREMLECQEALLLLTPYSIQKPWPMWEAGAVGGIALAASGQEGKADAPKKRVIPIRFNVPEGALPGPFVVTQAFDGTKAEALRKLLGDLMRDHDFVDSTENAIEAVLKAEVPPLLTNVQAWLSKAPSVVEEGTIVEWCNRLDRLREDNKSADSRHLHRWIRLMYEGPRSEDADAAAWDKAGRQSPWDIRLHLRLAENYTVAGQYKLAIEQYEVATRLAPLDVFVLHKLAKSYLDFKDQEKARDTIDRILVLDAQALKWNAEIAGLEGRYWKEEGLKSENEKKPEQARECFQKAHDFYRAAMVIEGDRVSYYLADNVGQMSLMLGDVSGAQKAYERAKVALESVTSKTENVWSLATRSTTALVLGDEQEALKHLGRISALSPPPSESEKSSVRRGLELVRKSLVKTDADYRRWTSALDG